MGIFNSINSSKDLENSLKQDIVDVMSDLYRKNLVSAFSGNASIRIPGSDKVLITPSGIHKARLRKEDIVKIDMEGNIVEGMHRPSSEWRFHLAIYRKRPDIVAVVHAHNPMVLALEAVGVELDPSLLTESRYIIKGVAYVPLAEPGSEELAQNIARVLAPGINAMVLRRHGVVALGKTIYEAQAVAEVLEDLARVQLYMLIVKGLRNCACI
uniref:Class II aldolase/adducin family protein n=1 Tax=Ignisphaera aggregans TaxID=334771 RepID=A0A7C2VGP9_9CREN